VILIGGEQTAYESCLDLFRVLSEKHYYLGKSGAGSRAKLASNLILGLNRLVLAEGLVFAERLGLDLEAFLAMLKTTPAYSRAMDVKGQKMLLRISLRNPGSPSITRIPNHAEYAERQGQRLPLAQLHKRSWSSAWRTVKVAWILCRIREIRE
jgi:3-hydroxyisobutyrate dehydrogenase-like beta-hydroxyacid dehydrogenase